MRFPEHKQENSGENKSNLFVKLKDGQRIEGIFRGEPHIFQQHWIGGKPKPCPGSNNCELCGSGENAQFRFRLNFITKENDVMVAKIWEGNYGTYLDLKTMNENDYDLETTKVSVTRSGVEQKTRYKIIPVKNNGGLTEAHFAKIAKIPLNPLVSKTSQKPVNEDSEPEAPAFDEDENLDF